MADNEAARMEFDRLAQQMAEVDSARLVAPANHRAFFDEALATSYFQSFEFLSEHPELVESYRQVGRIGIFATDEQHQITRSLVRLRRFAEQDLIESGKILELENEDGSAVYLVTPVQYAAFDHLFDKPLQQTEAEAQRLAEGTAAVEADAREVEAEAEAEVQRPAEVEAATIDESVKNVEVDTEEDELDLGDEINALDIIEHLRRSGFKEAVLAFVDHAMDPKPRPLAVLRKKESDFSDLSPEEYLRLKEGLILTCEEISDTLAIVGVPSQWIVSGEGVKVTYKFLVGSNAHTDQALDPKAGLKLLQADAAPTTPKTPDLASLNMNLGSVKRLITDLIYEGEDRRNMIIRTLTKAYSISRLESRAIVDALINDEQLFRNGTRGAHRLLAVERPQSNGSSSKTESRNRPTETPPSGNNENEPPVSPVAPETLVGMDSRYSLQPSGMILNGKPRPYGVLERETLLVLSNAPRKEPMSEGNITDAVSVMTGIELKPADVRAVLHTLRDTLPSGWISELRSTDSSNTWRLGKNIRLKSQRGRNPQP